MVLVKYNTLRLKEQYKYIKFALFFDNIHVKLSENSSVHIFVVQALLQPFIQYDHLDKSITFGKYAFDMRVADAPPLTYTGMDFAGPLYITSPRDPQSNESIFNKVYICLFTCASTCAVHLELTHDLGTNSFLQAFSQFSSRRGLPSKHINSNNAKTFKASPKEIKKLVKSPEVQRYLSNSQVT